MIARPINSWGASAQQSQAGVGWDIPENNLLLGLLQGKNPLAQGWLNLASKTPGRSQLYGAWRYGQRLGVWGGKYVAILCLTMSNSPMNPVFLSSSLQSMSALFLYVPALHKWPLLIIHESCKRTSTLPSCLRTAQLPWQPQKYILVEHPKPKHIRQLWRCMQCAHVSLHNSLLVHLCRRMQSSSEPANERSGASLELHMPHNCGILKQTLEIYMLTHQTCSRNVHHESRISHVQNTGRSLLPTSSILIVSFAYHTVYKLTKGSSGFTSLVLT